MRIFIIGAGGVGSWLTPSLALLTQKTEHHEGHQIILVDGDILEDKNLNRQLFTIHDLGENKASCLGRKYGINASNQWFANGVFEHEDTDWLIVCVDNNAARMEALSVADASGAQVIIAANETHSAEAYYYRRDWRKGPLDPRVYYPELAVDDGQDPMHRNAGCTGKAQEAKPQLVSANFMAAALAQHLFVLWAMEVPKMPEQETVMPFLPHRLNSNLSRLEMVRVGEQPKGQTDE